MPNNSTFASSSSEAIWINPKAGIGAFNGIGIQLAQGTGLGNYTSASTSYVSVDATNLIISMPVIPRGFICSLSAAGVLGVQTASTKVGVALFDGTTILQEQQIQPQPSGASSQIAFGIQWLIVGDGLAHVAITLQFKTFVGTSSVIMFNDSATHVPSMIAQLTQSNFI